MNGQDGRLSDLAEMLTGSGQGVLVAWFYDHVFIPNMLDFDDATVLPLNIGDGLQGAVTALTETLRTGPVAVGSTGRNGIALIFHGIGADSAEDAEAATADRAGNLISAVAYRQMGSPGLLGVLAGFGHGRVETHPAPRDYRAITNVPFVPEQVELSAIIERFEAHPQSKVLLDLFSEASRDPNPSAAVARLWAVLETISDRFPGSARERASAALNRLGVGDPVVDGEALTRRACSARNRFVHESRLLPDPAGAVLKNELADLLWFALRRSGYLAVDPGADYPV